MRLFVSSLLCFLLVLLGLVSAKSAVGDRILVVLEDDGEKNLYSQFWADLECRCIPRISREETLFLTRGLFSTRFQIDL